MVLAITARVCGKTVAGHVVVQFGVRGRIGNQRLVQRHGHRQVRNVHGHGALRRVGAGNQRDGPDDRRSETEPDQGLAGTGELGGRRRHRRVSIHLYCTGRP